MSREVFLGKKELDNIFSKQSVDDFIHDNQTIYYLSIPVLIFYIESRRKSTSLIAEMRGFMAAIQLGIEHNMVPIELSVECFKSALADKEYVANCVSRRLNPYWLSAYTSLLYGDCWWECTDLESFIDITFLT